MRTSPGFLRILSAVSLLASLSAMAGEPALAQENTLRDLERVGPEVLARDEAERLAALNRDIAALEDLWSPDMTVNAPNNTVVVGRTANLDTFVRGNIINFTRFDRRIEHVARHDDLFVLMGEETIVPRVDVPSAGLKAGETVRRRFTNIWRREKDVWRLFLRHANVIPEAAS